MSLAAISSAPRGALKIDNAVKLYDPDGARVLAIDHCSFDVAAGEICMIVGPSGCGKTTLLNTIAGFHSLDGGAIYLDGKLLCGPGQPKAPVGSDRVVVFQNGALFPWKTNLENIAFGPLVQKTLNRAEAFEKARYLMAEAGLAGHENEYPGEISSGLRRRVEIVRALINDPTVLLLDEPYRALDALTKSVMHEALLETHRRTGITIFFITHDLEEAIFLGHRVIVMTARPCRPKRIIDIDIPYPRNYTVLTSPRFRELAADISAAVDEEAIKSFELGEAEGSMSSDIVSTATENTAPRSARARRANNPFLALGTRRALISIAIALAIWEIGSTSRVWLGHALPILGAIPSPVSVAVAWSQLLSDPGYWQSWYWSFLRVLLGFSAATLVGVPFGLFLAISKTFRGIAFPVFELLRPIPPLAWVPASIIFWPTQELSIDFVIFLGAFYTIVLNVLGGARSIDIRLIQAARSMGATRWNIFRRILLPAVLPSICTGMEVGIGITWEVVIAAEMISGGGGNGASSSGGGLGFFIWNSYIGGSYPDIIVGMFSIGIAGYLSSAAVRLIEKRITPWRRQR